MNLIKFQLYDLLLCLASAVDLIEPKLYNHHQKVAYLSYRLAEHMGMPMKDRRTVLMQGLMHDIGALTLQERLAAADDESTVTIHDHAFRSAKLLMQCELLVPLADAVRYHHVSWDYGRGREFKGKPVPMTSHLLHLADRVCVQFGDSNNVLASVTDILTNIRGRENEVFAPPLMQVLTELGAKEFIWLELADAEPLRFLPPAVTEMSELDLDGVLSVSKIFSHVIDFRSHFTATHSAGVAHTAEKLAEIAGMSGDECKMIRIAGYLHDLGKLAIRDCVLEKPGKLNAQEYSVIRSHTFYTYRLLSTIQGFSTINQWASFHHERLNGQGYPFHLKGVSIPLGSRIMAVADVFTAVAEHRPYRRGMDRQEIIDLFHSMSEFGGLCSKVVELLLENLDLFIELCRVAQQQASEEYEQFFSRDDIVWVESAT